MKYIYIFIVFLYLAITTALYFQRNSERMSLPLTPFVSDDASAQRLAYSFAYDTTDNSLFIVRLVHNKVETSLHTFFSSALRAADIPFLFGLSKTVSSPYQMDYKIPPLFLVELPFFLFSCWYFITRYENEKKTVIVFALSGIVSLMIVGLFTPALHPLTLLPLVLCIRTFTGIGVVSFIKSKK